MSVDARPGSQVGAATRLIGFLGDPVAQARSPEIMNPLLAVRACDAVVVPLHLRAADFDAAIDGVLALANLDGLVITMPFKERIIARLDAISERAGAVGAVNAARRCDGRWVGDMFDGVGLIGVAEGLGVALRGARAGLVGAGGAGAAIAFALAEAGVAQLSIEDRDGARAASLAARVAEGTGAHIVAGAIDVGAVDLLVNATPVGMAAGDGAPIEVSRLAARTTVIDIVTRPITALRAEAGRRGCRHAGGAGMVEAQARAILAFLGY